MHLILATPAEGSLHRTYTQATRTRQRSPIAIARTTSAIIRAESKVITSDKSTFCLIRLLLADRSLIWIIEFKWKVHVFPILLHRRWTVVRRVQVCLRRQRNLLTRLPAPTSRQRSCLPLPFPLPGALAVQSARGVRSARDVCVPEPPAQLCLVPGVHAHEEPRTDTLRPSARRCAL